MKRSFTRFFVASLLVVAAGASASVAQTYEVTVTNITKGQTFTPILGVSHRKIKFFSAGRPARAELAQLAESGNPGPLETYALSRGRRVGDTATTEGLLGPGESATFMINTSDETRNYPRLSVMAMLIPTNDTFFGLQGVFFPDESAVFYAEAYDAGSEMNDEICASIPGPMCGGEGDGADPGEGFVHISAGIAGIGDLAPETYDWRSVVARVEVNLVP